MFMKLPVKACTEADTKIWTCHYRGQYGNYKKPHLKKRKCIPTNDKTPQLNVYIYCMSNDKDTFGLLLSAIFFHGSRKVDGNKVIEKLLELDRSGKLCEEERKFWIPPEFRCKN